MWVSKHLFGYSLPGINVCSNAFILFFRLVLVNSLMTVEILDQWSRPWSKRTPSLHFQLSSHYSYVPIRITGLFQISACCKCFLPLHPVWLKAHCTPHLDNWWEVALRMTSWCFASLILVRPSSSKPDIQNILGSGLTMNFAFLAPKCIFWLASHCSVIPFQIFKDHSCNPPWVQLDISDSTGIC